MKKLISNYHTHTFRCGHASFDPDKDYVKKAIELGYKNLGFSDHAPFKGIYHPTMRMDFDKSFPNYVQSIRNLGNTYKNDINIFLGLEIEYMESKDDYYKDLLNKYKLDYLILGQHCYYDEDGYPHFYFHSVDNLENLREYCKDLIKGINTGYFSYVCHPDIFLNSITKITPEVDEIIEKICLTAKNKSVPLEININGYTNNRFGAMKRGCYHYPSEYFFKKAKEIGNTFIFGVDAHSPKDFDKIDYDYFSEFLKATGIKEDEILKELKFKEIK